MPNKPGLTFQFDYKESATFNRTVKLDTTNFILGPEEIEILPKPAAFILSSQEGEVPPIKTDNMLTFLNVDDRVWQIKLDLLAYGFLDRTVCIFQELTCVDKTLGDNEWMNVNGMFHIYDWDGSKWEVEINNVCVPENNSLVPISFSLIPII